MVTRPRTAGWAREQPSVYTERPQSWVYGPETLINAMSLKDSLGRYSQRAERSVAGSSAWGAPGPSSRAGGSGGSRRGRAGQKTRRVRSPQGFPAGASEAPLLPAPPSPRGPHAGPRLRPRRQAGFPPAAVAPTRHARRPQRHLEPAQQRQLRGLHGGPR